MFTLRCEKQMIAGVDGNDAADYAVYEADLYEVKNSTGSGSAELKIFNGGNSFLVIFIGPNDQFSKVYVMNADGKTVDTITA